MRISRLYTNINLQLGDTIALDEDNTHYARNVLRLKNHAPIILFNGKQGEYLGKMIEVSRKVVQIELTEFRECNVESNLKIQLGLGISRGDRMDFSIQKAVELGVTSLTPLITERCVMHFKDKEDKKSSRWQHWKKIIQHATEQSGRTFLPDLSDISPLKTWVKTNAGLKVFLDPYANITLAQLSPHNNAVTVLVGPEGGFSSIEREIAIQSDFIPVRLGARILRTETASIAALSAVQMLWGDF